MADHVGCEVWKPIEGYEDAYEISNMGRCRSVDRIVVHRNGARKLYKGRLLSIKRNRCGQLYVTLSTNHKGKAFRLDYLVARTFLNNSDDDKLVHHLNGDVGDCRADNLVCIPLGVDVETYLNHSNTDSTDMEEWMPVAGWESVYEVSSFGHVRSVVRRIIRKDGSVQTVASKDFVTRQYGCRHPFVVFKRDGVETKVEVRDLVARTFLPNPNNYNIVKHKNGDVSYYYTANFATFELWQNESKCQMADNQQK